MLMVLPGVQVVEEELLPVEAKALREWGILFMISLKRKKICSFRLSASTWRPRLRSCFRLGFFEHRILARISAHTTVLRFLPENKQEMAGEQFPICSWGPQGILELLPNHRLGK